MKKNLTIVITIAITMAVTLVSCKHKDEKVKKLPSRIVSHEATPFHSELFYDEQNRLIKIIREAYDIVDTLSIAYNINGLPIKLIGGYWDTVDIIYQNNGRKIIISSDTFWLNKKGQFTRWHEEDIFISKFTYNSNGNIIKWHWRSRGNEIKVEYRYKYSDIRPIFRHVNTPEWLLFWLHHAAIIFPFEKNGYLPLSNLSRKYSYELDMDNYVIKMKIKEDYQLENEYEFIFEYEYILANQSK